ncbi:MAG TPA: carboxypeptidase regulatory-like domain-containing protein, partial [Gemmatimonadaceae bacterium]
MTPDSSRVSSRWVRSAFAVLACAAIPATLHAQAAPATGFTRLQGFVLDSIHNGALTNAKVSIVGTNLSTTTDKDGHYVIDSIPPGQHRVQVVHPLLDTLGIPMTTGEYPFTTGPRDLDLTIPGGERLAQALC